MNLSMVSKTAASLLLVGVLAACSSGGGSGEAATVATAPVPTTFTVSGTAATGAVFDNAAVTIIASDGTTFPAAGEGAVVTGADGSYTITLPLTAKPPFVVQAARDDKTLVSVVAEAKDTTTNITPVTHLIASRLSASGDPAKLADEIKNKTATVDAAAVKAKVAEIVALIQPLMDAVGDSTDPLNGNIQAAVTAGTGADKVLDSLSISITPSSATSVNIEIAVKQKLADPAAQPEVITFTNATTATELTAKPALTVKEEDLVASGSATLIADLLQRITACYALPQADRVASGGTAATDIVAPACKDIFFDKDPAGFKHNGAVVSSTGAFAPIFNAAAVGAKFDRGTYEFTRGNGDLVIAFRSTTGTTGSTANNVLVVRADTDTKLRAIGNQYTYDGSVIPYHELRTFVNQPAATYYSTGYGMRVNNSLDASGNSIFAKVVVTTPKGGVLTLKPSASSSFLVLVKSTGPTGTAVVKIRSVYADTANSGNPMDADTGQFSASPPATDAEIASFAAQSTWRFDYYLSGNATATPDATQYYKTRARAMTIPELQSQPLATLAQANIDDVVANTLTNPNGGGKFLATPTTPDLITLDWEVPAGALAPTRLQVYGGATVAGASFRFNDRVFVTSTSRTGTIGCSPASNADLHCTADGHFVPGTIAGADLWASDAAGREFAHFYAIYTVSIP